MLDQTTIAVIKAPFPLLEIGGTSASPSTSTSACSATIRVEGCVQSWLTSAVAVSRWRCSVLWRPMPGTSTTLGALAGAVGAYRPQAHGFPDPAGTISRCMGSHLLATLKRNGW